MHKLRFLLRILLVLILMFNLSCTCSEKIGILFIDVGTPEDHEIDWAVPFFGNLFDFFPPGFFAGGFLEGDTCYTIIHYANEAEAAICGVDDGTPIDAFCNEYTGTYPVHPILDHKDDGSYLTDCYPQISICHLISLGTSTIDPVTEEPFRYHHWRDNRIRRRDWDCRFSGVDVLFPHGLALPPARL